MKLTKTITILTVVAAVGSMAWAGQTTDPLKYSQPPEVVGTLPGGGVMINGWDEMSIWDNGMGPIVADDFPCETRDPVTDLHWWGSYPYLPPGITPNNHPNGFMIRFWSDVKAGEDPNPDIQYSHPGQELHVIECRNYTVERVGVDIDPAAWYEEGQVIPMDDAYQYNQKLEPHEYFDQQGTSADPKVYWLSIQAIYDDPNPIPEDLWGWKTRPHIWNDDGVIGFPDPGFPGGVFWQEVLGPGLPAAGGGLEIVSWDMAFEVTTPEPATISLLCIGGLALLRRRRR